LGSSLYRLLRDRGHEVTAIDARKRKIYPTLIHSLLLKGNDVKLAKRTLELYDRFNVRTREFPAYTISDKLGNLTSLWQEVGVKVERKYVEWLSTEATITHGSDRLVWIGNFIRSTPVYPTEAKIKLDGRKASVELDGKIKEADAVVLAAGAWNSELFPSLKSKPYFCWSAAVSGRRELDSNFVYDYEIGFYSRPLLGMGLPFAIVGDGDTIECKPGEKVNIDPSTLLEKASARLGKLVQFHLGWGHCEGTPDMRPSFGRVGDNLFYIGGLDGYGAEIGPALAEMLMNYILDGEENKEYMVDRFQQFKGSFSLGREPHELP